MNIRIFTTLSLLVASFFLLMGTPAAKEKMEIPTDQPPYTPKSLPTISFKDEKGRPTQIERFEGQVVVLNFWATWCGPCVEEMPALDKLQAKYGSQGLKVLTVSEDDDFRKVESFFAKKKLKHLNMYIDDNGFSYSNLGSRGLPFTLLIDHNNKEAARLLGYVDWEDPHVTLVIEDLLKRRAAAKKGRSPSDSASN